jgi:hypothetical protein
VPENKLPRGIIMYKHSKTIYSFVAVLLIFSMTITMFFFSTTVKAAVLGPKYYYLSIEKDNMKDLEEKCKDFIRNNYMKEAGYECKASATIGGDILKSDSSAKEAADFLSKFEVGFNYNVNYKDLKDGYYAALISAKYDGKPLGSLDIKSADNKTLISFPELTQKTISMEESKASKMAYEALLGDDQAFKQLFGITRDTYDDMVEKYVKDIIFKQIPDEQVELNQAASFDGINCNSVTFKLDGKTISNIGKAVAKELETDQDFKTMVYSFCKVSLEAVNANGKEDFTVTREDIDEQIKNMCDELSEEPDDMNEQNLEYTAYFNNSNKILSRQVKSDDVAINLANYKRPNGTDIFRLSYDENGKTKFDMTNELSFLNGSIFGGNFDINVSGKSLLEAQYTYDKLGQAGGLDAFIGQIDGKIHMNRFNDSEFLVDSGLNDITFSFKNQKKDDATLVGSAKISTKVDGSQMDINVATEVRQKNEAVPKPQISLDNSVKFNDFSKMKELEEELTKNFKNKISDIIPEFDKEIKNDKLLEDYFDTEPSEF